VVSANLSGVVPSSVSFPWFVPMSSRSWNIMLLIIL
jgi:hypothetical protein